MNERIRELTKQAISDVDYIHDDNFTNEELSKMYIPDCFAEKFAKLIVRECTELTLDYKSDDYYNGWLDYRDEIKQHFGVEE